MTTNLELDKYAASKPGGFRNVVGNAVGSLFGDATVDTRFPLRDAAMDEKLAARENPYLSKDLAYTPATTGGFSRVADPAAAAPAAQSVVTPEPAQTPAAAPAPARSRYGVTVVPSRTEEATGSFRQSPRMPRSYGFGSLFGAQVEAGAERGRRWEAEQGVRQQTADTAQAKGETDAAKALIDLNKAPDAPKIGLTEVQDPSDPLKMRYLLTEDGVPSPTSIDPSDPVQAQALRAFTRARMAGGLDARVPFDDFLKFARQQQTGGVDGGPK